MNRKRKLFLALVCAVGLAPCVHALDLEDCTSEFGAPARCGLLQVPEDRERPEARQIEIRIVVLSSSAAEPGAPVLMFPGGPGQAAADLAALALQVYPGVLEARDVVLVGQRGTRDSHALHCLEGVSADPSLIFGALWPREEIRRCWEKTRAMADPSRYATADYVADIEDALGRLGYGRVLLWGGSGGTRTAQAFLRAHPHRVVAMALDGVTAIDFAMPLPFSRFAERAWQRVVADCEAQADCARAYPDLNEKLDRLFALTGSSGAEAEIRTRSGEIVRVEVSRGDLAYALRGLLYNAGAVLRLPHEVDRAAGAEDLSFFAQSLYERSTALLSGVVAVGLHLSTYCVEDVPRIEGFDVVAETRDTFIGSYLVDEYRAACALWPVTPAPASWYRGFRSEVPTLLLSGYYDPSTPDVAAEEVGRSLPNHRHLVVRDGGHGAGFTCARPAVEGFLRTGSLEGIADPCPDAPPKFVVDAPSP